jgi:GT2 family glycosyltransferase
MSPFPEELIIQPVSRWPTILPAPTVRGVLARPVPAERVQPARKPAASIVMVTFNNLVFTRLGLETLLAHEAGVAYEAIIIDNGSTDGTREYLSELAPRQSALHLIQNDENRGFAAACNQGLDAAGTERLVILNDDTLVPPGWLASLVAHLDDHTVGLVGPVTNRSGNEAEIRVPYRNYGEFVHFAGEHMATHHGRCFDIRMLAMFCVALRRETRETIGALDERFEIGLFEDDDYAMRVRAAGLRVVCAEDVFVHHFGQASIGKLAAKGEYGTLFHANRERWETKWGTTWKPYEHRRDDTYQDMLEGIRHAVREALPPRQIVLVVSKGDDDLVKLPGQIAWHFPRNELGVYMGHHPADSSEAIALVESEQRKGARYIVFPKSAFWWLEHYADLIGHLEAKGKRIVSDDHCVIYALNPVGETS